MASFAYWQSRQSICGIPVERYYIDSKKLEEMLANLKPKTVSGLLTEEK